VLPLEGLAVSKAGATGVAVTTTVSLFVAVKPFPSVAVTAYSVEPAVAVEGLIACVVAPPGLHE
jgi:hypothetical protein